MAKNQQNKSQTKWIILLVAAVTLVAVFGFMKSNVLKTPQTSTQSTNAETGTLSRDNAVSKVKAFPEVIDYLKRVPNGLVLVNGEENNSYMVQVYELTNGHTSTFNWYSVDKTTGEVKKEF